jgi:hypothetical protein
MKPPMPIKPRGERGNRWLRYLFAALLLAVVVGGSAFAVTRLFGDDDDDPETPAQTTELETPESELAATDPTPTEEAGAEPTEAAADADAAEPTATEEPADEAEPTEEADPDQAEPTEEVAAADTGEGEEEAASSDRDAASFLPAAEDLEGVWAVQAEGDRPKEEVGSQLGDNGEELLTSWRWRENLYRDFIREDGETDEDVTFLSVSVHRFANEEGALEALTFFSDIVVTAQGLQEVPGVEIGDTARGLAGPGQGSNLYVLYVQEGNYVVRLGGSSLIGDPAPFVDAVATFIVDR